MLNEIQQASEENDVLEEDSIQSKNDEKLFEVAEILNIKEVNNETNIDELLAIIAEIGLDKKDLLEKILATDESEGVALNNTKKGNYLEVLVGKEIKTCYAKEDIDEFEKVTFVNTGKGDELFVSPLKTYNRDIKYRTSVTYDVSSNPIYYGEALPGTAKSDSKWRIKKNTYDGSGNLTDIEWADGTYLFNKVWDDRANYTYS